MEHLYAAQSSSLNAREIRWTNDDFFAGPSKVLLPLLLKNSKNAFAQ